MQYGFLFFIFFGSFWLDPQFVSGSLCPFLVSNLWVDFHKIRFDFWIIGEVVGWLFSIYFIVEGKYFWYLQN